MNRRLLALAVMAAAFAGPLGTLGCNAILGNDEGTLAPGDDTLDGGSDATTAPPGDRDATVADSTAPDAHLALDAAPDAPVVVTDSGKSDSGNFDPPTCDADQKLCAGTCVSTTNPVYGCGVASCAPCSLARGVAGCSGTSCALASCDPGYADCNQDPADGCEVDLSLPAHCGSCNAACGVAAPDCSPINGTFECITNCPVAQPTLCNNTCVDLTSSSNNCGECGSPCPAVPNGTTSCSMSACAFTCTSPYLKCGSGCVAPNDPTACGPACMPCPVPANASATCPASACSFTCAAGYGDCDSNPANGCEAVLVNKKCPVADAGADAGDSGS